MISATFALGNPFAKDTSTENIGEKILFKFNNKPFKMSRFINHGSIIRLEIGIYDGGLHLMIGLFGYTVFFCNY